MINNFECPNTYNSLDDFFNKISEDKNLPTNTYSLKEFVTEVSSEKPGGDKTVILRLPPCVKLDFSTLDRFAKQGVIVNFTVGFSIDGKTNIEIVVRDEFDLSILL